MRVTLGINAYLQRTQQKRIPVVWDSQTSMNGHIMIMGGSGAGKTHTARQLLNGMVHMKTSRAVGDWPMA
jgi:tRNA A37 threonylcarbamoyladenosine biosynthesis protein TsaE